MVNKKIVLSLLTIVGVAFLTTGCLFKKDISELNDEKIEVKKVTSSKASTKPLKEEKKSDLYSESAYDLPLFSIIEISKLPDNIKQKVDSILEQSQGFYYLKKEEDKVFIILQNPATTSGTYPRHELQFVEIMFNGTVNYHNAGYEGIDGEVYGKEFDKESWIYDNSIEPSRPLIHTVFDENKKIKFVENWNYDDNESVKYQMKDSDKKFISILKETHDNDSNYRKEHVFYDNDGKTAVSLAVNYDGANITRLTFFNSHDLVESFSIMTEYTEGLKTKELVYNEDYELVKVIIAEYADGERKKITAYNEKEETLDEISS